MERLNWHMADELSKHAQVQVVGPQGSRALKPEGVDILEAPLKPLPLFLLVALAKAVWLTLRNKPEVILAGSGLTAPLAWFAARLSGARCGVYLHGFDITVQHPLYQKLWVPIFRKMHHVIVNSTPTQSLALAAGVKPNRLHIVYPGVSLPAAPQPAEHIATFKRRYGLEGRKILLSVGRLTTRKGLREFVAQALPRIVAAQPDVMLVVVGEAPRNALGAGIQSVESIQDQAAKSGVAGHIRFLGVITDKILLATVYEAANVHVFPVRHIPDDPEGFGMVAIEAAAHGLPTVAFATGGIVDAVADGRSGLLVASLDYAMLAQGVLRLLGDPPSPWQEGCYGFAQQFAWPMLGQHIQAALGIAHQNGA